MSRTFTYRPAASQSRGRGNRGRGAQATTNTRNQPSFGVGGERIGPSVELESSPARNPSQPRGGRGALNKRTGGSRGRGAGPGREAGNTMWNPNDPNYGNSLGGDRRGRGAGSYGRPPRGGPYGRGTGTIIKKKKQITENCSGQRI